MYEVKTKPNAHSAEEFVEQIEHKVRKQDSLTLLVMMSKITGEKPVMWGESIVGFGEYDYTNRSGFVGKWFYLGFSPRKQSMSIYIMNGFAQYNEILSRLGKHKHSVSCLYVSNLANIDLPVLEELFRTSLQDMQNGGLCGRVQ